MSKASGISICLLAAWPILAAEPSPEQIEFFENKVRPIFAEHCYNCHSEKAEKLKGGLRLDSSEAILKGGDTAPAIIPGDVEGSLLIKAVRYTDSDLKMPPKNKKLSAEQIASLEAWVKMGAPLPRAAVAFHQLDQIAKVRAKHWAFQPVKKPAMPTVKNSRWIQTPVDNFILATLEKRNLSPAPMADRRTLIRRVTYDLIGLPPTYQEVEEFICDQRPDSYARLVDRMLDSPHYGERWARYWLDVARYADTKGYLAGGEERRYGFSYTYRDYVVRAFNQDKPYDQFLIEQIAADKLQLGEDKRSLAALGFLTLGRRFLNNQNDIIDDRIDVVTRGTLGLTVACARCHDHKFDPIPTKDYYSLHGVFASSEEPGELPLLGPLKDSADYQDYLKQKTKIEAESEEYKTKEIAQYISELRQQVGDYLLAAHEAARLEDQSKFDTFAGERKVNSAVLRRWMTDLDARSKKPDPIFQPWFELTKLSDADFATNAKSITAKWATEQPAINAEIAKTLSGETLNSLKAVSEAYTKLFKDVDAEWKNALEAAKKQTNAPPPSLGSADREALRQFLYAEGTPLNLPRAEAETILARKLGEGTAPFRNRIEALNWTHPGAPARAMAMVDRSNPVNSHVLKRGNPSNPGDEVPRHFLEILSATNPPPFTNGSGRLELARAIASPNNPLTARVYVNRVWLHHFGEGLVSTPGDFGVRTEEPVYRALVDYLAATFVENGWSTKALHRMILLSATYQQSSDAEPAEVKTDPENRLLSRMNRQRLDFEALRDTLLDLAGKLDLKVGGLPVDIESEPFATRRTIYGLIDRQNLPGLFRTFDFANPDTSNQGRFHTTVPQQALFLMNSPFVIEQARNVAQQTEIAKATSAEEKVRALYRLILQRRAQIWEVELGEKFLSAQAETASKLSPLERYAQVLLLSNELSYVD
jgi:mono/diheme cytochrome c family protein